MFSQQFRKGVNRWGGQRMLRKSSLPPPISRAVRAGKSGRAAAAAAAPSPSVVSMSTSSAPAAAAAASASTCHGGAHAA